MTYGDPDPLTVPASSLSSRKSAGWQVAARLRAAATSNTLLAILDQSVVSGSRFLTTIFIGRLCGSEQLGVYVLLFTLYLIFSCVQEAMMTTPYTVFGNRLQGAKRYVFAGSVLLHGFILSITSALIVSITALALSSGWGATQMTPAVFALATVLPFMLLWEFARKFALAHLNLGHALLMDVATASLQIAGVAWLAWHDELSAAGAYLAVGLGCACTSLAWIFLSRRKFRFRRSQIASDWSRNLTFGKWVLGGQLTGMLHGYTPAWVLALAIGTSATGVFAACENIVLLCNPLILAIANLFGVTTARAYADGGYPAVRKVVNHGCLYGSAALGLLWLVLVFAGESAVVLLYGDQFSGNGHVVSTIAFAAPMWVISSVLAVGLRAVERPDTDFRARVAGLLITLIASVLTAHRWGVPAVAYSLVAGSAASALWQAYAFYRVAAAEEQSTTAKRACT